jgi:thioredoxin-related protein
MSGVGWLFVEGLTPEALQIGSKLPEIIYQDKSGEKLFTPVTGRKTLIVYFSPDCGHCDFQLKEIETNIKRLDNVRIFLFTTYDSFLEYEGMNKYPDLMDLDDVAFGIVDYDEYKSKFGSTATPTTYIADENGEIAGKFKGREKFIDIEEVLFPGFLLDD